MSFSFMKSIIPHIILTRSTVISGNASSSTTELSGVNPCFVHFSSRIYTYTLSSLLSQRECLQSFRKDEQASRKMSVRFWRRR